MKKDTRQIRLPRQWRLCKKRERWRWIVLGGIKKTSPKKKRPEEERRIKDMSYLVGCDAHKAEGQDPWCLVPGVGAEVEPSIPIPSP